MKKLTSLLLASVMSLGIMGSAVAEEDGGIFAAENFSATLTLTSSYMYRGISFSDDQPALQGSFDWGYGNWFAGAWSSSLQDQDAANGYSLETDFYGGYWNTFAGIDWFIMPIYYHFWKDYKRNAGGQEPDVFEVWLDATKAINDTFTLHAMYAYSPDFFWESGDAHYVKGDVTVNLPWEVGLNLGFGYQDVEGTGNTNFLGASGWSYTHWEVGLTKSLAGFDFDLRYHDTSDDDPTDDTVVNFAFTDAITDDTLVFTVSRSF